jgi:hypothetical protein
VNSKQKYLSVLCVSYSGLILGLFVLRAFLILGLFWAYSFCGRFLFRAYLSLICSIFFPWAPRILCLLPIGPSSHRGDPCFFEQVFFPKWAIILCTLSLACTGISTNLINNNSTCTTCLSHLQSMSDLSIHVGENSHLVPEYRQTTLLDSVSLIFLFHKRRQLLHFWPFLLNETV